MARAAASRASARAAARASARPAPAKPSRSARPAPAKPSRSASARPARPARSASARPARPARSAPRPRSARAGGIRWEKVGRLALLGVLGIIFLLYIPPVTHWFQQSSTAERSEQRLQELEAERARLRARLRELSGPGAIEREARKLGMTRRDERPYVVRP